jgi:Zn-dependent protease
MKWSLPVAKLFGIRVYIHFTFFLLLGFLAYAQWKAPEGEAHPVHGVGFILLLFGCVLLHEFGHALMARRFGIETKDITLLPIGGVARLERMPEKPMQEFWVALAGPAVNVVIAAALFAWLQLRGEWVPVEDLSAVEGSVPERLLLVNLALVVFNLLPAFPMDGGRVLRALLATVLGRRRATAIAANIGQGMAILLGLAGFLANPMLVFIAIFVFLGAQAEAGLVEMQSALEGLRVRDAMMTRFRVLSPRHTLGQAAEELLAGSQQDFPVLDGDQAVGLLRRNDLVKALAEGKRNEPVASVMLRDCGTTDASEPLRGATEALHARGCASVPVFQDGRIIGLLTLENIGEMIMVQSALASAPPAGENRRA